MRSLARHIAVHGNLATRRNKQRESLFIISHQHGELLGEIWQAWKSDILRCSPPKKKKKSKRGEWKEYNNSRGATERGSGGSSLETPSGSESISNITTCQSGGRAIAFHLRKQEGWIGIVLPPLFPRRRTMNEKRRVSITEDGGGIRGDCSRKLDFFCVCEVIRGALYNQVFRLFFIVF